VRARSAVFDLYGDHLPEHGHWAPISSVVTLLRACGVQPAATRTAVSRLAGQGWLRPEGRQGVRGYLATTAAQHRLGAAHHRIYRRVPEPWDGRWHLVVVDHGGDRSRRDRVAATLRYLAYGQLDRRTWVAARANPEVPTALDRLEVSHEEFSAQHLADENRLAARVWDLDALSRQYRQFRAETDGLLEQARLGLPPGEAYPVRTALVHEWRKFLFVDPDLPVEVLPTEWPGTPARQSFLDVADRLAPAARIFVSEALASAGAPAAGGRR